MPSSTSGLSLSQQKALAICPKVSSSISMICSTAILYEVFLDKRNKGKTTAVQRVLVSMSCIDILASLAWFMSTWAAPKETGWAYASGNQRTCNAQGFLLQLAIGAPLYNSSLALYYLLLIKKRWTEDQLAHHLEKWVHGFILIFTIGTSILMLPMGLYNHIGAVCWVIGDPVDCGNSSFQGSDVPCERGNHAWAWGLALFYIPLWISVIACCISMVILYLEVRGTHRKSDRYANSITGLRPSTNRSGQDTSRVAMQAILYSLSFLVSWAPSTCWSLAKWFGFGAHFGFDIAAAVAEPLQGLWNFIIFVRSRPRTLRKIHLALSKILPCCIRAPTSELRLSDLSDSSRISTIISTRWSTLTKSISKKRLSSGESKNSSKTSSSSHSPPSASDTHDDTHHSKGGPPVDSGDDQALTVIREHHFASECHDISEEVFSKKDSTWSANFDHEDADKQNKNNNSGSKNLRSAEESCKDTTENTTFLGADASMPSDNLSSSSFGGDDANLIQPFQQDDVQEESADDVNDDELCHGASDTG